MYWTKVSTNTFASVDRADASARLMWMHRMEAASMAFGGSLVPNDTFVQ